MNQLVNRLMNPNEHTLVDPSMTSMNSLVSLAAAPRAACRRPGWNTGSNACQAPASASWPVL